MRAEQSQTFQILYTMIITAGRAAVVFQSLKIAPPRHGASTPILIVFRLQLVGQLRKFQSFKNPIPLAGRGKQLTKNYNDEKLL